MMHSLVR